MTSPQAILAMNAATRRHPEAAVGDTFGPFTVTKTLPRGHKGRSDERVEWTCTCGRKGASWVFNLRKAKPECCHVPFGQRRLVEAIEAMAKLDPSLDKAAVARHATVISDVRDGDFRIVVVKIAAGNR